MCWFLPRLLPSPSVCIARTCRGDIQGYSYRARHRCGRRTRISRSLPMPPGCGVGNTCSGPCMVRTRHTRTPLLVLQATPVLQVRNALESSNGRDHHLRPITPAAPQHSVPRHQSWYPTCPCACASPKARGAWRRVYPRAAAPHLSLVPLPSASCEPVLPSSAR